jgi:hypothetical protein
MRKIHYLAAAVLLLWPAMAFAQLPDETNGRIPELDGFHKPIYALWHEAWPAKDITKLKALFPDVEKAYTTLAAAKLPGILRDKQAKWDEKLQLLTQSVTAYRKAVEENNSEEILKSTEAVHMNYEQMVRVVRPALAELDAFHQQLYLLHHYYVPEKKSDLIISSADSLTKRMAALNMAELPKRLEAKKEQYSKARKNLDEAVSAFADGAKAKKGHEELAKLENAVHARYEVLEKVFE